MPLCHEEHNGYSLVIAYMRQHIICVHEWTQTDEPSRRRACELLYGHIATEHAYSNPNDRSFGDETQWTLSTACGLPLPTVRPSLRAAALLGVVTAIVCGVEMQTTDADVSNFCACVIASVKLGSLMVEPAAARLADLSDDSDDDETPGTMMRARLRAAIVRSVRHLNRS